MGSVDLHSCAQTGGGPCGGAEGHLPFIPEQLEISGVNLTLNRDDAIVSGNLAPGCYETYNLTVFENMLRPGICVVDVGAKIGLYSAIAAKRVGSAGRVVAVEPDAANCPFIRLTRERNDLRNLIVVEKAAGAISGQALLHLCKTNKADHRTYSDGQRSTVRLLLCSSGNCERGGAAGHYREGTHTVVGFVRSRWEIEITHCHQRVCRGRQRDESETSEANIADLDDLAAAPLKPRDSSLDNYQDCTIVRAVGTVGQI